MLVELKYLSEQLPADPQTRNWYRYYKKEYDFDDDMRRSARVGALGSLR